jgi:hypothetical protein
MRPAFIVLCSSVLGGLLLAGAGCRPRTHYPVSGTVTVAGAPLKTGKILFMDPDKHHDADVGNITDGKFDLMVRAGQNRVEIRCGVWTGEIGNFGGKITDEGLPKRYNADSRLTYEVKTSGKNVCSFDLDNWEPWAKKRHP